MTEHTVEVVTAPAAQKITCPGCGYVFRELITEIVGASQCPGCGDQINYDRDDDEDSSTADDTEQSDLLPDGGMEIDEAELVDELYALRKGDRVDLDLVGKGEPMAIVDEVETDTDGQTETAVRTIAMETLAKRTISVTIGYDANTDESELSGATIDGPEMADARPVEIAGVAETAQQTLEEAMGQPSDEPEWPPETTVLYCRRCGEEHEHDRTTSEKTGERAWKCPEHNILNDPLQPRLGAFTGGERA